MHSKDQASEKTPGEEHTYGAATIRSSAVIDLSATRCYQLAKKDFEPQYANVYFSRLKSLGNVVLNAATAAFGEAASEKLRYAKRIVDISSDDDVETVVVGVIFRHMPSKPSILAQYEVPSRELIPPPPGRSSTSYVGQEDSVFFEDEYGRCTLDLSEIGKTAANLAFVTGFVLAIKGLEDRTTGTFKVKAFASAGQALQPSLPPLPADKFVCLASGLGFGRADADGLSHELLLEFLRGNSGDDEEVAESAAIVQLIIAGNVVSRMESTESGASAVLAAHRPLKNGEKERVAAPIAEVDRFLSACTSTLPVALMPGDLDPVNYLLPQQPFHRCLLPNSARNENLARVTNPFQCSVDRRLVLGTSGQPVTDFALYEESGENSGESQLNKVGPSGERVLDILELMVNNRHLAPTCPDTLASYPFADGVDPFVLTTTPHIFFAGNQREFASRLLKAPHGQGQRPSEGSMDIDGVRGGEKTVRAVSVPRFDETGQVVLVNLRTLECSVREFALTM